MLPDLKPLRYSPKKKKKGRGLTTSLRRLLEDMTPHLLTLVALLRFCSKTEQLETTADKGKINESAIDKPVVNTERTVTPLYHTAFTAKSTTGSSLAPSSSDYTYFTLPYLRNGCECRNIATDFVYQNNLCDAHDPKSYLGSKRAFYSCAHQCSHKHPYSERSREQCACDDICVVYDDCCRDMSVACPQTYTRGKVWYRHFEADSSFCDRRNFLVFTSCLAKDRAGAGAGALSTKGVTQEPKFFSGSQSFFHGDLPVPPGSLKKISESLSLYRVTDISSGTVFANLNILNSCRGSEGVPYFLPVLISLNCSAVKPPVTAGRTSAIQVLKECRANNLGSAITPFHRTCQETRLIRCRCINARDGEFTDHIHNSCIGPDESVPLTTRYRLWSYHLDNDFSQVNDSQCGTATLCNYQKVDDGKAQMSISPFPVALAYKSFQRRGVSSVL